MAFITGYWSLDGTIISTILTVITYFYLTHNFKYWKKRGVLQIPPTLIFGNFKECLFLKKSPSYFLKELYERKKDVPYIGFYIFNKPFLLLRDRTVIRHVLTSDSNFDNRYSSADPKDRIGYANLFFMRESQLKWKFRMMDYFLKIFNTQTPAFDLMLECGKHLDEYLDSLKLNGNGQIMDVMDVSTKFTMDVIWSIGFGCDDVDTFKEPDSDYSKHAKTMLENNYRHTWKMIAIFFLPNLTRFLKLKVFDKKTTNFMSKIFWQTMLKRYRYISTYSEYENPPSHFPHLDPHPRYYKRYDLIDILVDIKWNMFGRIYTEDYDLEHVKDDDLLAQAASFFLFGFETISTTVAFALYELALQPEIQYTLRREILEELKQSNGRVTHSMILSSLPYLDMVVSETLRMYPPLGFLNYVAKKNYQVPEHNLVIEEGTPVYVSLLGLHYDSKYFRNPNIFDPERFNERNKRNIPEDLYIPFGRGGRYCIAKEFGLVQTKLILLKILSKYKVTRCKKTSIPVEIDPRRPMTVPLNNVLYLKVQKINPLGARVHSKKKTKKTKKTKRTKKS